MKTGIILAALAVAYLAGAAPAEARDWYILSGRTGCCTQVTGATGSATPEAYHNALRSEGVTDSVAVRKVSDGSVFWVELTWT